MAPINLILLQLLPVLYVSWHAGVGWGLVLAVAMTAVQIALRAQNGWDPSGLVYFDLASDFGVVLLLVWIQALLKAAYQKAHTLAHHDNLTNTLNRAGFYNILGKEIERRRHYAKAPFALVYFDCDNFKQVNDKYGHHVGDALLATVASVALANLRHRDLVSRLGGDEFAILLPECDEAAANTAIAHFKRALDDTMANNNWDVGFSIGIAVFTHTVYSVEKTIELADGLMYAAKKSGKNRIVLQSF
jgi:diguanylate cyclase (GGDEF)-like protein